MKRTCRRIKAIDSFCFARKVAENSPVNGMAVELSVVLFDSSQTFFDRNGSVARGDRIAPRQKHMCRACMYGPDSVPQMYGISALPPKNVSLL